MRIEWNNKYTTIAVYSFLVICASILLYLAISEINVFKSNINSIITTLLPFIIGGSIAYILNFVLKFFEDKLFIWIGLNKLKERVKRGVAMVFTYFTATLLIYLFMHFVLPQLIDSIVGLANNIPQYVNDATIQIDKLISSLDIEDEYLAIILEKWNELVGYVITVITNMVPVLGNLLVSLTSSVFNIIIGIIISIYILIDKEKFVSLSKKITFALFPEKKAKGILEISRRSNEIFGKFLSGKILDSIIIGVLTFIILAIFKMPYTLLISVIIGITNIIPFFGPFIGAIPSAIIILFVSPVQALWFIGIIIVIQQLDGNIIGPKILGDSIGISAFWILFSLLIFSKLLGIVGMIIGVPIFAVVYSIIKENIEESLKRKGLPTKTIDY
jgi:predicted PurR-regulated permease PerM